MTRALDAAGLSISDVSALLISHEHSDHVREMGRFAATTTTTLSTRGTALAAGVSRDRHGEMQPLRPVTVSELEIVAIPVSHDAHDPCGFLIRTPAGSVTVFTDLGKGSGAAAEAIAEASLVVLEANHDEAVLRRGPYPAHLQRRILSDTGHLSNVACAELLATALHGSRHLPTIWLAHLSATNNRPHLAVQTVKRRLAQAGLRLDVHALPRQEISETWSSASNGQGVAQLTLGLLDVPSP